MATYLKTLAKARARWIGHIQQNIAEANLKSKASTLPPELGTNEQHQQLWQHRLEHIEEVSVPVLWGMFREAEQKHQRAHTAELRQSQKEFEAWVLEQAEKGAGALHRWTKASAQPSMQAETEQGLTGSVAEIGP